MQFLVELNLPNPLTKSFIDQIPAQREVVDAMLYDGVIQGFSLAADWSKAWLLIEGESESDIFNIVYDLPLADQMEILVHPLIVSLRPDHILPVFSQN